MVKLNLSGNRFCEEGGVLLGPGISEYAFVPSISEYAFVPSISEYAVHRVISVPNLTLQFFFNTAAANDSIEILDLSWNQIRRRGALAIAAGLKVCTLQRLQLLVLSSNVRDWRKLIKIQRTI